MQTDSRIYVAGHTGMVGSAIVRRLQEQGYSNLLLHASNAPDLRDQAATQLFFREAQPEYVFDAAAKVGGIAANNTYRADFLYDNLMIQSNLIHAAYLSGVKKLLFLGSSCIYPKDAPQPLKENYLLDGQLEPTNEPYAIAKIAGIKLCENYFRQYGSNFISAMPTNLYGPNDRYDLEKSHVLPALMRKFYLGTLLEQGNIAAIRTNLLDQSGGKLTTASSDTDVLALLSHYGIERSGDTVTIRLWGSGEVYREFLHVDDLAAAAVHLMEHTEADELYNKLQQTHINVGTGQDSTINYLAMTVKRIAGFNGAISWDKSKPDGTFRKQLDVELIRSLGWKHTLSLEQGISRTYGAYARQQQAYANVQQTD